MVRIRIVDEVGALAQIFGDVRCPCRRNVDHRGPDHGTYMQIDGRCGDYLGKEILVRKARHAAASAQLPRSYWDWEAMLASNAAGSFPYTPATNLLYGLREALLMLQEEGLANVFARHDRHAEATRRAVRAWGLDIFCADPAEYSSSLTAVCVPDGHDADALRKVILDRYDMSLGAGLGKLKGRIFRIGHLGDFNDLMLAGTLCGVEMGLALAGVPHQRGGVDAALDYLAGTDAQQSGQAAAQ